LLNDHKTATIKYAYQRFIEFSCNQHKFFLGTREVPERERRIFDGMWSRLMQNGAEAFFLEEAAAPEDEVDIEIAHFFTWVYARDGWTTFRPYWKILRITWKNYKAMGLDLFFESTEVYSIKKR
jgi:hypothetical protein